MPDKNFPYLGKTFAGDRQVSFGDDHDLRTASQGSIKSVKFPIDDAVVGIRITCGIRYIKKMHQNRSPRQVAQKTHTESMSAMGALNEPWHVSHDKGALIAIAHNAEVRNEGRKGKVGNPWTGGRHGRDQRRLPGVGKPDQADIRQQAEFKLELPDLSGQTRLGEAGGTVCGGGESGIPSAASPALGDHDLLAGGAEVGQYCSTLSVARNGSGWDRQD